MAILCRLTSVLFLVGLFAKSTYADHDPQKIILDPGSTATIEPFVPTIVECRGGQDPVIDSFCGCRVNSGGYDLVKKYVHGSGNVTNITILNYIAWSDCLKLHSGQSAHPKCK